MTLWWSLLLAMALAWPSHVLGWFDGLPLSGRFEAVIVGVVVPCLWWLDRSFVRSRAAHVVIVVVIAAKAAALLLPQEGWCARFTTTAPFSGEVLTMRIDEPRGFLRSWDVRADWRAETPRCTAVFDRAYLAAADFPAWFVNLLDFLRPGRNDLALAVDGYINTGESGTFAIRTGQTMRVRGRIGNADVSASGGADIVVPVESGSHEVALDITMTGDSWRFEPLWNGADAWHRASLTTAPAGTSARAAAQIIRAVTALGVAAILALWLGAIARTLRPSPAIVGWMICSTAAAVALAMTPRFERLSGAMLLGSALVPVPVRARTVRTAFFLLGVPWLAFFVAHSFQEIGRLVPYSIDDWLAYQAAGYRVVMNGYWLEGGTPTFDYQPLYRWITGVLHLVFGDSSIGETYADAAALLAGALLAASLVKPRHGYRAALIAGSATLATFTLGTIWYFVGRGLSEIAAAGFVFLTAFALLRARLGSVAWSAAAGVLATLMFYTRLNHLILALALTALLLPLRTSSRVGDIVRSVRRVRVRAAMTYLAILAAGVAAFSTRTWWYTGVFSLLYGTSLKNNDTGLRLSTLASADVWRRVTHSLAALLWMNEPPRPDPRGLVVVAGVLAALAAALQIRRLTIVPAGVVAAIAGSAASAFFVHTHNYPGRMTIHLVPFAAAAFAIGVGASVASRARQRHDVPSSAVGRS